MISLGRVSASPLEYRRDIRRFLRRERDSYPAMPQGYFDRDTVDRLTALRERFLSNRHDELPADFTTALVAARVRNTWRSAGTSFYRNWLLYLCAQKDRQRKAGRGRKECKRLRAVTFGSPQESRAL